MKLNISRSEAMESFRKDVPLQRPDRQRAHMLIALYFPQLEPEFQKLESVLHDGSAILRDYAHKPDRNQNDDKQYLASLRTWLANFGKAKHSFSPEWLRK